MSGPTTNIIPIYLRLPAADIAEVKFVFESHEGVGIVRTVDARTAVIVVLAVPDFLAVAHAIIRDLQGHIDCVEVAAPALPDDWLMREIAGG